MAADIAALKPIYEAPNEDAALEALTAFAASPVGLMNPHAVRVFKDA